jgi:hypothetical protein
MAYVKQTNGTIREVLNLGWILRHWQHVERLEWISGPGGWNNTFRAYLKDGREYVTDYACFEVWKGFINRPVFRGLPATVDGITGRI